MKKAICLESSVWKCLFGIIGVAGALAGLVMLFLILRTIQIRCLCIYEANDYARTALILRTPAEDDSSLVILNFLPPSASWPVC